MHVCPKSAPGPNIIGQAPAITLMSCCRQYSTPGVASRMMRFTILLGITPPTTGTGSEHGLLTASTRRGSVGPTRTRPPTARGRRRLPAIPVPAAPASRSRRPAARIRRSPSAIRVVVHHGIRTRWPQDGRPLSCKSSQSVGSVAASTDVWAAVSAFLAARPSDSAGIPASERREPAGERPCLPSNRWRCSSPHSPPCPLPACRRRLRRLTVRRHAKTITMLPEITLKSRPPWAPM